MLVRDLDDLAHAGRDAEVRHIDRAIVRHRNAAFVWGLFVVWL